MEEFFKFYSKLNHDGEDLNGDRGLLLEPTDSEWFGDKNKGLAQYLDKEYANLVNYIHYNYASGGFIEFTVSVTTFPNTSIKIHNDSRCKLLTLKQYIRKYIAGQISDGWGENGIYIVPSGWIGDEAYLCDASDDLLDENEYKKEVKEIFKGYPENQINYGA